MTQSFATEQSFSSFQQAIERYPVLDRARELALSRRYLDGDKAAGDLLVCANLRNVVKLAIGYRGYGFQLSELVAEGNVGLLHALRRFEPERGLRFMTYAAYWVRAQVLAHILKRWSVVSVGTGLLQSKLFFRLKREKAKLAARLGEGADLTPILAEIFETSEPHIRKMEQRIDGRDMSLDARTTRESKTTIMDTLVETGLDAESLVAANEVDCLVRERVAAALGRLEPREQVIVRRRLLGPQKETLSAVGEELGLSRERVRQLEQRVKVKLQRALSDLRPLGRPAALGQAA